MGQDEKAAFWQSQYSKCIRCYACRNILFISIIGMSDGQTISHCPHSIQRPATWNARVTCSGMKNAKAAARLPEGAEVPMANACKECRYPNPVVFDRKIGQDVTPWCTEKNFADVEAIEAMNRNVRRTNHFTLPTFNATTSYMECTGYAVELIFRRINIPFCC